MSMNRWCGTCGELHGAMKICLPEIKTSLDLVRAEQLKEFNAWSNKHLKGAAVDSNKKSNVMTLPTDSKERKEYPLFEGCVRYFPAALAGVSKTSKLGNDKHNPGEALHHARGKSMDHGDCIIRHLIDVQDLLVALERGNETIKNEDVLNEVNQMAWRVLAFSQELHEKFGAPLAPGAKK